MKYLTLLLLPFITSFLVVPSLVHGLGGEEDVLDENPGTLFQSASNTTKYYCTYRNLWTKERHPVNYPEPLAHWAGPIMWTHTTQFELFRYGYPVTTGIENVAEDGFTDALIQEIQQGSQVFRWSEYPDGIFFTSQRNFVHIPPIEANFYFPYLSMVAGMGPSPDWFTGFYTYWLINEYTRTWYDHIHIQTKPWDAGTDAGTTYDSVDSDLDPPLILSRINPRNAPAGGELMDSRGISVPNVGELECYLIVGDEPFILPDCDWFADPCCNETTKECGTQLPYGRGPTITDEYLQVLRAKEETETQGTTSTTPPVPTILILETAPDTEPSNLSAGGNGDGISSSLGIVVIAVIGALVFSF